MPIIEMMKPITDRLDMLEKSFLTVGEYLKINTSMINRQRLLNVLMVLWLIGLTVWIVLR